MIVTGLHVTGAAATAVVAGLGAGPRAAAVVARLRVPGDPAVVVTGAC